MFFDHQLTRIIEMSDLDQSGVTVVLFLISMGFCLLNCTSNANNLKQRCVEIGNVGNLRVVESGKQR
jgi:hypothetical protein